MSFVKLEENGQVTIPVAVREQISARTGDIFEVAVSHGNIVLRPKDFVMREAKSSTSLKKCVDILS